MIVSQNRRARNRKAVVFCCDRNVVDFSAFIADQILRAEKTPDFDICIATFDATLPETENSCSQYRICAIREDAFQGLQVDGRIPNTSYIKLALPEIFARDYARIIYLDTDVFLQGGRISRLFAAAPAGRPVSGVHDLTQWLGTASPRLERYWQAIGVGREKYMNAGVILYDVAACNASDLPRKFLDSARQIQVWRAAYPDMAFLHCQTALNATLRGDWNALSLRWNWPTVRFTIELMDEFQPFILHFVGEAKPWAANPRGYARKYLGRQLAAYQDFFAHVLNKPLPHPTMTPPRRGAKISPEARAQSLARLPMPTGRVRISYFLGRLNLLPKSVLRRRFRAMEAALAKGQRIWPVIAGDAPDA